MSLDNFITFWSFHDRQIYNKQHTTYQRQLHVWDVVKIRLFSNLNWFWSITRVYTNILITRHAVFWLAYQVWLAAKRHLKTTQILLVCFDFFPFSSLKIINNSVYQLNQFKAFCPYIFVCGWELRGVLVVNSNTRKWLTKVLERKIVIQNCWHCLIGVQENTELNNISISMINRKKYILRIKDNAVRREFMKHQLAQSLVQEKCYKTFNFFLRSVASQNYTILFIVLKNNT